MSKSTDTLLNSGTGSGRESAATPDGAALKLGLIGDNIGQSKAPLLHTMAGRLSGLAASYDRLVPRELETSFDQTFDLCVAGGYRGINITYPYKEEAARRVDIDDSTVRAMGAVNTVLFEPTGPKGFNTDYSGFIAAYRGARGDRPAGRVCMIGAGGVGKAIAFALLTLGLQSLLIVDLNVAKAEDLAARLRAASPQTIVTIAADTGAVAGQADGLINCTPVGMVGYEGTPLPRERMAGAQWAFDAVYTPLDTPFLGDAEAEGLTVISGFELFFHQGVDAWQIFAGRPVDTAQLRRLLMDSIVGSKAEKGA